MNHDDKKPNSEMRAWIEPELEARVVAWVAGEASAFEVAELERFFEPPVAEQQYGDHADFMHDGHTSGQSSR